MVARAAGTDALCAASMDMFVKLYARVAADHVTSFLPPGGVFLAGGIPAKNEERFLGGGRFMSMFEGSYAAHVRSILAKTPVLIVKDYSISLYGAANAAVECPNDHFDIKAFASRERRSLGSILCTALRGVRASLVRRTPGSARADPCLSAQRSSRT